MNASAVERLAARNRRGLLVSTLLLAASCVPERAGVAAERASLDARFVGPEQWLLPPGAPSRPARLTSVVLTDERLVVGGGHAADPRFAPEYRWWWQTDDTLERLEPIQPGRSPQPVPLAPWGGREPMSIEQAEGGYWALRRFDELGDVAEEILVRAESPAIGYGPAGWVLVTGGWRETADVTTYVSITPIELSPLRLGTPRVTDIVFEAAPLITAGTETHQLVLAPRYAGGASITWFDASLTPVGSVDGAAPPLLCGRRLCLTRMETDLAVWSAPAVAVRMPDATSGIPVGREPVFAPFGERFVEAWTSFEGYPAGHLYFRTLGATGWDAPLVDVPMEAWAEPIAVGREGRAVVLAYRDFIDSASTPASAVVRFDDRGPAILEWAIPELPELPRLQDRAASATTPVFVVSTVSGGVTAHLLREATDLLPAALLSRPYTYDGAAAMITTDRDGFFAQVQWQPTYGPPIMRAGARVDASGAVEYVPIGADLDLMARAVDYRSGARFRLLARWGPEPGLWAIGIDEEGRDVGDYVAIPSSLSCYPEAQQVRHDLWVAWCNASFWQALDPHLVHLPAAGAPSALPLPAVSALLHASTDDRALLAGADGMGLVASTDAVITTTSSIIPAGDLIADVGHDGRDWIVATHHDGDILVRWLDDLLVEVDRVVVDLPTEPGMAMVQGLAGVTTLAYTRMDWDTVAPRAAIRTIVRPGANGEACRLDAACASGHCVGGACCDGACGPCGSCAGEYGPLGTCVPLPAGMTCRAPASECDAPEVCDGTSTACPGAMTITCPEDAAPEADVGASAPDVPDAPDAGGRADAGPTWIPTGGGDCRCTVGARQQAPVWSLLLVLCLVARRRSTDRRA